jgi:hypothetical protein
MRFFSSGENIVILLASNTVTFQDKDPMLHIGGLGTTESKFV